MNGHAPHPATASTPSPFPVGPTSCTRSTLAAWSRAFSAPPRHRRLSDRLGVAHRRDLERPEAERSARRAWLESHFRWQIRTFWFGLLWVAPCYLFVIFTPGIGLLLVWLPLGLVARWFIYRIVRGWMALGNRQMMYV
jgi:hypothetical protein